jgi:NAD(P)-dependent dehydrogenase (short-subunit alcohol dehydrogenase family)
MEWPPTGTLAFEVSLLSRQHGRDQLEVNLFGVFRVTHAVLPVLREQCTGHIIQVSSIGGVAAFPVLAATTPSKWALEVITESLAQEGSGCGAAFVVE